MTIFAHYLTGLRRAWQGNDSCADIPQRCATDSDQLFPDELHGNLMKSAGGFLPIDVPVEWWFKVALLSRILNRQRQANLLDEQLAQPRATCLNEILSKNLETAS